VAVAGVHPAPKEAHIESAMALIGAMMMLNTLRISEPFYYKSGIIQNVSAKRTSNNCTCNATDVVSRKLTVVKRDSDFLTRLSLGALAG
jgi:hypothetical protein